MNARMTILAPVVIAAVVGAVGCGGGSGTSDGSEATGTAETAETTETTGASTTEAAKPEAALKSSSLSKAAFIRKADAACLKAKKNLSAEEEAYLAKHSKEGSAQNLVVTEMVKTVLLPTIEAEIAVIRKLGAPAGDEEEVGTIVAEGQAALEGAAEAEKMNTNDDLAIYLTDVSKDVKDYGFTACVDVLG